MKGDDVVSEFAYRFRIYPNKAQQELIQKTFGCCRFVFNYFLSMRKEAWENGKRTMGRYECNSRLPLLKSDFSWLKEVDSSALQGAVKFLDCAFSNYICDLGHKRQVGYPCYKRKHDRNMSYHTFQNIHVYGDSIRLPKVGNIKCRVSKNVKGRILSATVSRRPSGKYFVSICCADVKIQPLPSTGKSVGVDLGIKDLAITSDGVKFPNSKYTYAAEKKLGRLQRSLSRKTKGSANWEKARVKVARLHERIANQRRDTVHKITTSLIRDYDVVCIEDLNAKGMAKSHHLAKSVADSAFGEFRRQLEYKSAWYGKAVSVVDRFYLSSQLCSACGTKWAGTKDLKVRKWVCPQCGASHDRDVNAAVNILNEGLRQLA